MIQAIKKIMLIFFIFISILFTSIIIWFFLPVSEIDTAKLVSDSHFAYIQTKIESNTQLIELLEKEEVIKFNSDFQKKAFKTAIGFYSPIKITAAFSYLQGSKKPDYLVLIDSKRLSKTMRVAWGGYDLYSKVKNKKNKFFIAFLNNIILVSNRSQLIQGSLNLYKFKEKPGVGNYLKKTFLKSLLVIAIFNNENIFSDFIHAMEEKSSFKFFPRVDSMERMEIIIDLLDENKAFAGRVLVYPKKLNMLNDLEGDLVFLFESIKRFFLAYKFDFNYNKNPLAKSSLVYKLKIRKEK